MKKIPIAFFIFFHVAPTTAQVCDTLNYFFPIGAYTVNVSTLKATLQKSGFTQDVLSADALELTIHGYTDCPGSSSANQKLSALRAKAIENFFTQQFGNCVIKEASGLGEYECTDDAKEYDRLKRRTRIIICKEVAKNKDIAQLARVTIGETLQLKGLNFKGGTHFPTDQGQIVMQQLLDSLLQHPTIQIEIQGHVCCVTDRNSDGPDLSSNGEPKLSENRAKHVYEFLKTHGIDASRMRYKGFGGSRPLQYPEITEQDMNENRRVEILIIDL